MFVKEQIFRKIKNEQGAAAVEFALLLLPLTLLLLGIIMFGLLFHSYLEITHAAREGVRWASLRATQAEVESYARSAAPGIDWANATVTRAGVQDPVGDDEAGDPVTVTITYDVTDLKAIFGTFASFIPDSIQSSATQRVE